MRLRFTTMQHTCRSRKIPSSRVGSACLIAMLALFHLLVVLISNRFKSRRRLEIENLYLRHQLNIAVRRSPHRLRLRMADRALLIWMTWLWPNLLNLSCVVRPGWRNSNQYLRRWHLGG